MKFYDMPGAWFGDHPNARRGVATVVAGLTFAVGITPAIAAHSQQEPRKNPGGIKEYKAPSPSTPRGTFAQ